MGDWTIFQGVDKGGGCGWGLTSFQLLSHLWSFCIQVFHYFDLKNVHVLYLRIIIHVHNTWCTSLDALRDLVIFSGVHTPEETMQKTSICENVHI